MGLQTAKSRQWEGLWQSLWNVSQPSIDRVQQLFMLSALDLDGIVY